MAGCRGMGLSRKTRAPSGAWDIAKETYSRRAPDEAQPPQNGTEGCATEVAQTKEERGRRRERGGERSRKREREREYHPYIPLSSFVCATSVAHPLTPFGGGCASSGVQWGQVSFAINQAPEEARALRERTTTWHPANRIHPMQPIIRVRVFCVYICV